MRTELKVSAKSRDGMATNIRTQEVSRPVASVGSNQGGAVMHSVSLLLSIMGFALELTVFLMTVTVL